MRKIVKNVAAVTAAAVIGSLGFNVASAEAIVWTLNNVQYTDGTTIAGSFDYDSDTNTYSSINIVSSAGTTFPFQDSNFYPGTSINYTSTSGSPTASSYISETVADTSGSGRTYTLNLQFLTGLTNAGGTIDITAASEEAYSAGGFSRPINTALSPTVSAVPIPFEFESTLGLVALGSMFGGYTLIKKRKQQKSLA
ncbi:hypothetical protein Pse7367_2584 [Thalassoporum mexicanum PCC 7367]|nr:hypothetical protein Pse7367_2584 [Pseudanabaena sp. PCC 7367]